MFGRRLTNGNDVGGPDEGPSWGLECGQEVEDGPAWIDLMQDEDRDRLARVLAAVDFSKENPFIILAPETHSEAQPYAQALKQKGGFVLELRLMVLGEERPGFRHYRAVADGLAVDDDLPGPWLHEAEVVHEVLVNFGLDDPATVNADDLLPEGVVWRDVTSQFVQH